MEGLAPSACRRSVFSYASLASTNSEHFPLVSRKQPRLVKRVGRLDSTRHEITAEAHTSSLTWPPTFATPPVMPWGLDPREKRHQDAPTNSYDGPLQRE
jgi:hypothetical protein